MSDYKTLRVPEDAWEDAKQQKEANDRTWGEQIVRPDSDKSSTTDSDVVEGSVEVDGLTDIKDQLDRIESAQANTVSESLEIAESVDKDLGDEIAQLRRDFDEFKHQLPRQVAEELR